MYNCKNRSKCYSNITNNVSFSNQLKSIISPLSIEIKESLSKVLNLFPWQITEIRLNHLCRRGERNVRSKLHRSNRRWRGAVQRKPRTMSRYFSKNVRRRRHLCRKNVDETILDTLKPVSRNATPRRAVQGPKASNTTARVASSTLHPG